MNDLVVDRFFSLNQGPPTEFNVTLPDRNKTQIHVRTRRLTGAPYWLYQAYAPKLEQPILELISWPSISDLEDAYPRAVAAEAEARIKAAKEKK